MVGRALDANRLDHVAAAHERVHLLEQLAATVEDAGAGGPQHLVPAERIEVASERAHVDALVRRALRPIDQHGRAGGLGPLDHVIDRVDGAEGVADLAECDEPWLLLQQLAELVLA